MGGQRDEIADEMAGMMPWLMHTVGLDLRFLTPGLISPHFRLLAVLNHHSLTMSDLAESQSVTLATMSSTVATLVERGWVRRKPCESDRRVVFVELTEAGENALAAIHGKLKERIEARLARLDENELADLRRGLEVMQRIFSIDLSRITESSQDSPCQPLESS